MYEINVALIVKVYVLSQTATIFSDLTLRQRQAKSAQAETFTAIMRYMN